MPGNKISAYGKALVFAALIICFIGISVYTSGCADEPSSLGLNMIPPGDTSSVRIFDSYIDTMVITAINHRKLTNTSGSGNLMVGKTAAYDSKGLLQFYGLDTGYTTWLVNSATLTLKYRNYYFPSSHSDSLGQIGFDVYKITKGLNLSTITLDSVNSSTFGTVSQGNYTGFPTADTQIVDISLNTQMVKDWLINAKDTGYANKNYGIVLSPSSASTVIKGFYSASYNNNDLKPELKIILSKNNVFDTLKYDATASTSLANTTISQTSELFYLQCGVSYIETMKFDMSKIPSNATINDVQLYLTLDSAASILSPSQASKIIGAERITDTAAGIVTDNIAYNSTIISGKYVIRLISGFTPSPFQRWLLGEPNYGIYLRPSTIQLNLDMYAFYNTTASDPATRPRIVIKYTPRAIP
jgi:hypothetical protein